MWLRFFDMSAGCRVMTPSGPGKTPAATTASLLMLVPVLLLVLLGLGLGLGLDTEDDDRFLGCVVLGMSCRRDPTDDSSGPRRWVLSASASTPSLPSCVRTL